MPETNKADSLSSGNIPWGKNRSSLAAQIKGRWREFCREPSALFFVVFMPILWMVILGFAFSNPKPESYGVGWPVGVNSGDVLTHAIKTKLAGDGHVRLKEGNAAELERWLKRGDILLIVKPGESTGEPVHFAFDPTNRDSQRARGVVDQLVQHAGGQTDPVPVVDETISIPGTRYIDFLVPGLLALSIMTSSLFGTGMTIVANRRENLLKRYVATPMKTYEYIVSHIVGRGFILVVELAAVLVTAALIFHFRIAGSFFEFVAFAALGAAAFTAIGILCGSRTTNMATMNGLTNLISLPMMLLSGVWFSRGNFPGWLGGPARLLPLTPIVDGLRRIALEGAGIMDLKFELAVLAAYLVVCTVAAKAVFKWY